MFFWVTFDGYKSGMVSGKGEAEAKSKAEEIAGAGVKTIDSLPYPALPKLHEFDFPPFCFKPNLCKGHSSCPQRYACSN